MFSMNMKNFCGENDRNIRFKSVRFKSIDYISEASARCGLMRVLYELPVPLELSSDVMFPHGCVQDTAYRTPWSKKISSRKLPLTGSLMEDLKECTRFGDCLERYNVFQIQTGSGADEVIPSSNPDSQFSINSTDVLHNFGNGENTSPWEENFSPCTTDYALFSYDDLTLPEEVIFTDNLRLKKHLPSVYTMLQRLKLMTVSDPFLHSSVMLSEDVIFRCCASYSAASDARATEENVTEVFNKEAVLTEETLMLPVEVHMESVRSPEAGFSCAKLKDLLRLNPESMEVKNSCADIHLEVVIGEKQKTELEVLQTEECCCTGDFLKESRSPVALRLHTELELDLPLSSCDYTHPDLFLPDGPLTSEQLSPVYKQHFISDSDFENMEKSVWMAEKYHESVAGFFLAETQISKSSVHTQTLTDLLTLLKVKNEDVKNKDQPHLTDSRVMLPENFTDLSVYTANIQTDNTNTHQIEKFSPLSIVQIDEMLFAVNAYHPTAVHLAHLNPLEIPKPADAGSAKTVSKKVQPGEINCKKSNTEKHMYNTKFFKNTIPVRSSETKFPPEEQLSFSKEGSKSPQLKYGDIEKASTIHKLPEQFDQKRERTNCVSSKLLNCSSVRQVISSEVKSHDSLDPLSSFMMLRTSWKSPVLLPRVSSPASSEVKVGQGSKANTLPAQRVNTVNQLSDAVITEKGLTREEKPTNETIYVQATESQRNAYRELNVLAVPSVRRVVESGINALNNRDFGSVSSELTSFLLKQHERKNPTHQLADGVFDDITLLHVLVTLKDLLLKCDLYMATDYLSRVRSSCDLKCLSELMKKFEVLQYLSVKRPEPDPKLLELHNQMRTWMNSNRKNNNRVLVLTLSRVNTEVLTALRQVLENSVCVVVPDEEKGKVKSREVINSLSRSRCVVLCRQHVGADFPWQSFNLVFEIQCVDHSPFSSLCSERNIKYISLSTAVPELKHSNTSSYLDSIPFVLLVTEGLLKRSRIQRALETTYDMTLLERKHPPSAQKLGGDCYDVITVDENTAVFLQELSELEMEKASNRVVMRLSALSLQFTRCWLIFHCTESHRALISRSTYINLVLIYSSFVLFGQQAEKFDVKVLLACEEEEIARYIYEISLHTLINSDRDALNWLERDWISLQTTKEECCLLQFPCINPLIAQLMLSKAPSLQWLLEASLVDLQKIFPHVSHKVIQLFTDITAKHRLIKQSEDETAAHFPPQPQTKICQSLQSEYFTISLSGRQEGKKSERQFQELNSQSPCIRQENHISDPVWPLSNSHKMFSQCSTTVNVWQSHDEEQVDISNLTPEQADVISGPRWTSLENITHHRTGERKRQRTEHSNIVPPQFKKRKLLCERVPGRNDGQTRLRFF